MNQYQIPDNVRESITQTEIAVSQAVQRNIDELRALQQVLEEMQEQGFQRPYGQIYVVRGPSA